jgi:hypothetical protein
MHSANTSLTLSMWEREWSFSSVISIHNLFRPLYHHIFIGRRASARFPSAGADVTEFSLAETPEKDTHQYFVEQSMLR